jgi:hypothetical protein
MWRLLAADGDDWLVDRSRYIASVRDWRGSDKALLGRDEPALG